MHDILLPPPFEIDLICFTWAKLLETSVGKFYLMRMGLQPTHEFGSGNRSKASEPSESFTFHAATRSIVPSRGPISENIKSDDSPAPTSLLSLAPRSQPFPFILPQPLGPLASPPRFSSQAALTATRTSATLVPVPPDTYFLPGTATWGSQGVNQGQYGRCSEPRRPPAPAAGIASHAGFGIMNSSELLPSNNSFPRHSDSQSLCQPATNRWHGNSTETRFPSHRHENIPEVQHGAVLERPSAGSASDDTSELIRYHECDECHEAFTSASWLKRHKTTHVREFRCGCGAAYTDKTLLSVSIVFPPVAASTE